MIETCICARSFHNDREHKFQRKKNASNSYPILRLYLKYDDT